MDQPIKKMLWRVWDGNSNGINTPTKLVPQLMHVDPTVERIKVSGLHFDPKESSRRYQIQRALNRKPASRNSFIFFTESFAQVLIHAIWQCNQQDETKKSRKHPRNRSSIYILGIDIATAKNEAGHPVNFRPAREVVDEFFLKMTEAHIFDEEQDFKDVFMTTDTIIPGPGSIIVDFETLESSGLYKCVPELDAIKVTTPGVASPSKHLRAFWFKNEVKVPYKQINLAAKLAALFKPTSPSDDPDLVSMDVFAWLLTMKDQGPKLPGLRAWLRKHAHLVGGGVQMPLNAAPTEVPEVEKCDDMMELFSQWYIRRSEIENPNVAVPKVTFRARRRAFCKIRKERNIAQRRRKDERIAESEKKKRERGLSSLQPWTDTKF